MPPSSPSSECPAHDALWCPLLPLCPRSAACLLPCAWEAQGGGRAPRRWFLPGAALTFCPATLRSYLAIPASSWVDDFIDWLTPASCCRIYAFGPNKDEFCPSTVSE